LIKSYVYTQRNEFFHSKDFTMLKNVLVIDNDELSVFITKHKIIKSGFAGNVITFRNGQQALHYFMKLVTYKEKVVPEFIFLDISLPIMDGWTFLRRFAQIMLPLFPDIQICILSYQKPSLDLREIVHPCVISFITKPLCLQVLNNLKKHECLERHFKQYT
jgi:CheY-like chemotaxis protein